MNSVTPFFGSVVGRGFIAGLWAAVSVLAGRIQAADVVITELHYQPRSAQNGEEFVELQNLTAASIDLAGWRFSRGVSFTFPPTVLPPGGLVVVAADTNAFAAAHPGFGAILVGNWTGSLSDRGETLELQNGAGTTVETLTYATEGDWGDRGWGAPDHGFRGLEWISGHAGQGQTLERIDPRADGSRGQNWRSSSTLGGSPGQTNSVSAVNRAPFITDVSHLPAVPRSAAGVTVRARLSGGAAGPADVAVRHRVDGTAEFIRTPMWDDGTHADDLAGDGLYAAQLPAQPSGTVVEFYVTASAGDFVRTWPAPLSGDGTQVANALYQVDDSPAGTLPRYRLIVTEQDRQTLAAIEAQAWHSTSDAEVNATFVALENGVAEIRYQAGLRIRGSTSRDVEPPSRRVALPDDRTWRGGRVIALNGVNPHSQVAGAALAQLAGLPAARSRLVEVRENGVARGGVGSPVPGLYAQNEALNGDFTDTAFPDDGGGNLYSTQGFGSLDYLGEWPTAYADPFYYAKETNARANDWSDLIELTRTLNQTPGAALATQLPRVADVEEWVRFFAVNTLLANFESTLSNPRVTKTPTSTNVVTGDYFLYRGIRDPRFRLVPYDFDSCLGVAGVFTVQLGLYRFLDVPAIRRVFNEPAFASRYHAELRRLAETVFAPEHAADLFDRLLAPHVPAALLANLKSFNEQRRERVLAELPTAIRVTTPWPVVGGYAHTTAATVPLAGVAATAGVVAVQVSGVPAIWDATRGQWAATVPLWPGLNRLLIETLNATGQVVATQPFDLWREAPEQVVTSPLRADTRWRAADGPFRINAPLVVPAGVTLTLDPGVSVQFAPGAGLVVQGRLLAQGTAQQRIQMLLQPRLTGRWNGVGFDGATNENRLTFADLRGTLRAPLQFTNSTARLERLDFPGHYANVLWTFNSSLHVVGCNFPDMFFEQAVEGYQLPADGYLIFEGNVFGTTVGYADIIDFSGGSRPGPIPQFLNNVFLGGSDDGLDLDGTDAHIEGNVFMHFRKNHPNPSSAAAIGTGRGSNGETSRLTVVRNLFYDNDHDFILKDYAELTARQNTFVGTRIGSLAFSEPLRPGLAPPISALLRDNLWWQCQSVIFGLDTNLFANPWFKVRIDNSIFNEPGIWLGTNNFAADPRFVNAPQDFHLAPASPARGLAPGGLDLGAHVPAGAVLVGAPLQPSTARTLSLAVLGAGLTHYRSALDGAPWSEPRTLETPLVLTNLAVGAHELQVLGLNSAGVWQAEPGTVARWSVVADFGAVQLNEVLADNAGAVPVDLQAPDLVELFNPGNQPLDLAGMSLSDTPERPRKFVFPPGTVLPPAGYLILYADSRTQPPGIHLGFAFNKAGEAVLLYDSPLRGGGLVDRVAFGAQLPGRSLGRGPAGDWTLCQPTLGAANQPLPLGDARRVRLNEWLANPGPLGGDDQIELFNPEPLPVLLNGLNLTDAWAGAARRAPIYPLTFIAAGGFVVLTADGSPDRPGHLGLALASDFGSVMLTDSAGAVLDSVLYGSQAPGLSEGRQPDGHGPILRRPMEPTLGASNGVAPAVPLTLSGQLSALGASLNLTVVGVVPGQWYRLETRVDFNAGWTLAAEASAVGDTLTFEPLALAGAQQFLRVVSGE